MTSIESKIGKSTLPADRLYEAFSDLSRLDALKDNLPADKVSEWNATPDTLSFKAGGMVDVKLRIVDREPGKTIKVEGEGAGMLFNFWMQLKEAAENDTRIKLTFRSDMNFMMRTMFESKIKSGLDKMIDGIEKFGTVS